MMDSTVIEELLNRPVLPAVPFHREAGSGPAVVCIHCNASSSSQWRSLMDRLAPRHRVLAPDTHGAGRGPAWPTDRTLTLRDEVALLEPVFARAGAPFALVGHSYGGAVALLAALKQPERVNALVLYEPTLFALVDAASPAPNAVDGIRETVARATAALAAGDRGAAAEAFIDYLMRPGSWAAKPEVTAQRDRGRHRERAGLGPSAARRDHAACRVPGARDAGAADAGQ